MTDYPTEEEVLEIANWGREDWIGLLSRLRGLWSYADVGFWHEAPSEHGMEYHISTAGWSGNEELLDALKKAGEGMFWFMCWQQSRRGGHYIFQLPKGIS